jgi:hypothetical protein
MRRLRVKIKIEESKAAAEGVRAARAFWYREGLIGEMHF